MSTTKLTRIVYWGLSLFLMLGMWLFSQPSIARAGTITVTNTLDDGTGSLRQAIAGAASSDTIVFDDSLSGLTITLTSTLAITQNLMIDGSELTTSVTLDGNNTVRIFKVANNAHFTLADVILTQGRDPSTECDSQTFYAPEWVSCGGGIKIEPGSVVTATNITVQRSHAYMGGGIYNAGTLLIRHSDILSNTSGEGGGIHNTHYNVAIGALTVQTCTIAGNTADAASLAGINAGLNTGGGGIYDYDGSVTVQDSTLSGNVAASPSDGGGIWSLYGSVLVQNSTLSGNSAPYGGGIYNYHATVTLQNSTLVGNTSSWHSGGIHAFYGTLHYQNTLMADNVGGDCGYTFSGPIGTNINNWVKDGGCSPAFSGDPFVGPLADNGGETLTHLLSPFSLAVDAGDAATSRPTDQRGMSRPMNAGYDIGAVEVVTQPLFRFSYAVPPSNTVPYYGGIVTYTLVLTNISSVDEPDMRFITTLPDNVTGGGWVTPTDGLMTQNTYTATFAIPAGMTRTLIFTATHDYGLQFANTVYFSNTAYNQPFPLNAGAACAPIFFVRNSNDSGPDSLRQGLTDVCAGGLITFAQDAAVYLNSELATAGAVTIDGSGYAITLSGDSGNDGSRNVRVLNIGAGHSVTLSHLSLVNGIAASGGGIYNAGLLNMTALTLTGNLANGGFDDNHGGALYNAGTVQAQDSQFTNNQADSIYSNRYGRGGGIYNAAGKTITLTHCTIASNQIPHTLAEGGGGYNAGTLTLHECTIADNQAVDGNGVFNTGALQVNGSTFSGNVRYSYDVGYGGALNHAGGAAWIQNSTFSGNRASYGGGIYNTSMITLQNSTLSDNVALYTGGGLHLESGSAYLYNTLIANSSYGDCVTAGGVISASVHNLIEDGSCGAAFSSDPALAPLGDNGPSTDSGQATLTHALLPNSLAIDAGDPATCLTTDQRGVTRPQNGACDIGAVEAPPQPVVRIAKTVTPTLAAYHGVVTYTLTLTNTGAISDTRAQLTDVLPDGVAFSGWVLQNGAIAQNHAITWTGTLTPGARLSFIFTATHQMSLQVANTAAFSGTAQLRQATATFNVACPEIFTVQNSDDSGTDSLRQGIADVCPGGRIVFVGDTMVYLNSELAIAKELTIDSSGYAVTLSGDSGNDGSRNVRVLNIAAGHAVTLSHLSIVGGHSWGNGAGIANAGRLTLAACTLSNHDGAYGGAIYNTSHLTVTDCVFRNNNASYGGGIRSLGQVAVVNSTFSGNTAYEGGGIHSTGVLTLTHTTLADNTSSNSNTGGGIRQAGGTLYAYNTLIAHSGRGGDCYVDSDSVIRANVNNWIADGTCSDNGINFGSGDPLLDPLNDNDGPATDSGQATLTYALPVVSPAVDAGDAAFCPPTDQRGKPRPVGAGCDIGAYELGPLHLTYTVTPTTDAPYHGLVTYTLALANTGSDYEPALWLTATLPEEVLMAGWIVSPSNTTFDGNAVTWHGDLAAGDAVTATFQEQHTGEYAQVVNSKARFTGATDVGRAHNAFTVECALAYQVTTAGDSGMGSLRNALAGTCESGVVSFAGDTTIYLSSTLPISKGVTVDGSGHAITLSGDSGNDGSRDVTVFYITAGDPVTLSHLNIVSGSATFYGYGGGIINIGNLRLLDSTLADNQAAVGGAIFNGGVLTLTRCALLNNAAEMGGGILAYGGTLNGQDNTLAYNHASDKGGGVYNYAGNLTFQNSTLSHNTAENDGGGIHNEVGSITLTHSTLADNAVITGTDGGGGYHQDAGTLYAYHTLIANSVVSGTAGGDCVIAGGVIAASVNTLIEDGACGATVSGDPKLGPLQDNGSDTATRALLEGSPAIDAIPAMSCTLTTDQRRMPRPYPVGGACDIGAYESLPTLALVKTVTPTSDLANHGAVTYTLVFSNSGAVTETQATLRDSLPPDIIFGAWIVSPTATLRAGNGITWDGTLAAGAALTWSFTALHTGDYGDIITNTATFSGAQNGSAAAAFTVIVTPTYVITPTWGAGGSITPGTPQTVTYGSDLAFTIAPDTGYHIADVWVDGSSVGTLSIYTFTKVITDHTISATFSLSATTNHTPTANAGPDQNVTVEDLVTLDGSGSSDPDAGDTLTYNWVQTGGDTVTLSGTHTVYPTFTASTTGTLTFTLTITDSGGLADSDSVSITVTEKHYQTYLPLILK